MNVINVISDMCDEYKLAVDCWCRDLPYVDYLRFSKEPMAKAQYTRIYDICQRDFEKAMSKCEEEL